MDSFEKFVKLSYIAEQSSQNKIVYNSTLYFWDSKLKIMRSLYDILENYMFSHYIEGLLQEDIVSFLTPTSREGKNIHRVIEIQKFIDCFFQKKEIPTVNFSELPKLSLLQDIPFTEKKDTVLNDDSEEFSSEVYILTKDVCWPIFYKSDLPQLPNNMRISSMTYKDKWRISVGRKSDQQDDNVLQIELEYNKKLACVCFSRNYLTICKFLGVLNKKLQYDLMSIFDRFCIVGTIKKNIKIKFVPKPSINKAYITPVLDLIMTGELSEYLITNELETLLEQKKRINFTFFGKKIGISKSETDDDFHFKIIEPLSDIELKFVAYALKTFVREFHNRYNDIIKEYEKHFPNKIVEKKKERKTKHRIDTLRGAEPTIFGDFYTQDCQYTRQPYIVDASNFQEALEIVKKDNSDANENYILEFPNEKYKDDYPFASQRYYACKNSKYPYPLIQTKLNVGVDSDYESSWSKNLNEFIDKRADTRQNIRGAPCCFSKIHKEKTIGMSTSKGYSLTNMKNVLPGRKGALQNYLSSFQKGYRYGLETFEDVIKRLGGMIEEVDLSDMADIQATSLHAQLRSARKHKFTVENVYYWSYVLGINICIFELLYVYNTLIVKMIPMYINMKRMKFKLLSKNTSGNFELVMTETPDFLTKYLQFCYTIYNKEKILL